MHLSLPKRMWLPMFDRIRKQVNTGLLVTLASFVVPVLIFVVALKLGFKDTDLPVSLTMRRGSFDLDLFRGIENDIEAAQLLTFGENLREIIHYHADPFFILFRLSCKIRTRGPVYAKTRPQAHDT